MCVVFNVPMTQLPPAIYPNWNELFCAAVRQPRSATEEALAAEGMSKEEIIKAVADEHERQKEDAEVGGVRVKRPFACHDAVSQRQSLAAMRRADAQGCRQEFLRGVCSCDRL